MHFQIISRSPENTVKLGHILAQRIQPGDIIAFSGDLGAGKTCLIQGICRGLEVPGHIYITSPTFVLLNIYKGRMPIYHFDFYRVFKKEEIIELGYEEYFFAKGVCLIEWAERAEGLYPEEYLRINIRSTSHSERKMEFCVYGEDYHRRFSGIDLDNI